MANKKCRKFHIWLFQTYGMICAICGHKVIWEEKVKKK